MKLRLPVTLVLPVLATLACTSPKRSDAFNEHRVSRQDQAGSIHFAVLSVAPWEYYIDALQPEFNISEEMALAAVVPATRSIENTMLDITKAQLGVERSDESDRNQVGAPPPVTPATTGSSVDVVSNRPLKDLRSYPELQQGVSLDPMTKYWAATAFYQEVQLLSRYVQHAAVRVGFRPYLVRIQVSLLPSARNEPYDAYCTLAFFITEDETEEFSPMTISSPLKGAGQGDGSKKRVALPGASLAPPRERGSAHVLPLMVTDNLEASIQSSTMQTMRQLAATVSFISGTATGGVDAEKINSDLQQVLGSDLNSLLTVSRVSDNTLRVRLGAMQQATAKYAMVPRNHNITLLLMVPEDSGELVRVVAKSTMVDAETGRELPQRDHREINAKLVDIMDSLEISGVSPEEIRPLVLFAQANDQRAFDRAFDKLFDDPGLQNYKDLLWLDMITLMIGSQYSATEFDLPRYDPTAHQPAGKLPPQTATVRPGPSNSAVATLSAAIDPSDSIDARYWSAALEVQQPIGAPILVPSEGVFLDPITGHVNVYFPPHPLHYMTDSPSGEITLIITDRGRDRRFSAAWQH